MKQLIFGFALLTCWMIVMSSPALGKAAYFISSSVPVSIRIDCNDLGRIEAKASKQFVLDFGGDHWIEGFSPEGVLLSREMVPVPEGTQKTYEIPVGRGMPGVVAINGAQYKTVYLFGQEWLGQGLREANGGYFAQGLEENQYIWEHVKNFIPSGTGPDKWRIPRPADFSNLVTNLQQAGDPVLSLKPGGRSGMNISFSGEHSGSDPADHRGWNQYAKIWTDEPDSRPNHQKVFFLNEGISFTGVAIASHSFASVRYVRDFTPKGPCSTMVKSN